MEVLDAIKTRRSIRKYKTTPVDDKTIELVLEAAHWAPSWANTQCWRFIVVRDNNIKAELANTIGDNPATEAIRNTPVVIVVCAKLGRSGYYHKEPATDKGDIWYMFDVALATQNLMLAAHSLGLGTVPVGLFDAKRAANILELPKDYCVVLMTPLGYPDQEPRLRPRKGLPEIVFYDKFSSK